MKKNPKTPTKNHRKSRFAAQLATTFLLILAISLYFTVMASAQNAYAITDGSRTTYHSSRETDLSKVLDEAGISVSENDLVTAANGGDYTEITIQRSRYVTVDNCGEYLSTATYDTTVAGLLDSLGISMDGDTALFADGMILSPETPITDGMSITLSKTTRETVTEITELPYTTATYLDPQLAEGETLVKTEGVSGQQESTYENVYVNGVLTDTVLIHTRILSAPVNEVLLEGSAPAAPQEEIVMVEEYVEPEPEPEPEPEYEEEYTYEEETYYEEDSYYEEESYEEETYEEEYYEEESSGNTYITPSGETITYVDCFTVESTAYCLSGTTATGTTARYGAVAVDPDVIPYGTKMYIISNDGKWDYGIATAEDCGGAINGYMIDLYYSSYDTCINFGRRNCTVYVIEWG